MKLLIVGTGYVGLVTGTCFAEMGFPVTCLDIDKEKIALLNESKIPIYESGLQEMVERNLRAGRLRFTTEYPEGMEGATVCFLCVNTPPTGNGEADLTFIERAARQVGQHMEQDLLVVNKSTVPVGSAEKVESWITQELRARSSSHFIEVASNPEFLKEGDAVKDCMKPDRVILGVKSEWAEQLLREIYHPFTLSKERFLVIDRRSAELAKYAANCMLATRISFMNELSRLCELVGADIESLRQALSSDSRIGKDFLWAGVGFGGSCFPKDLRAFAHLGELSGIKMRLATATYEVNERQKRVLGEKIIQYLSGLDEVAGKSVGILGLAFKPNTDDMREAPSLTLIGQLLQAGLHLRLFDPVAMENAKARLADHPHIHWCNSEVEAATGTDALALVTEWKQFRGLDLNALRQVMKHPALFDGRNQIGRKRAREAGFAYFPIGSRHEVRVQ